MSTSVYARLGGYDKLVRVLDGVCSRMMRHERLKIYFKGHSSASKRRLTQNFLGFVCERAGGPGVYGGPDIKTAHEGLGITSEEWNIFFNLVRETAAKQKLTATQTDELLKLLGSSEKDIVEDGKAQSGL